MNDGTAEYAESPITSDILIIAPRPRSVNETEKRETLAITASEKNT
jgi:hypothetical protein